MCLACEQQEYFFRLWCAKFLARGKMPPGVTAADLQALGLSMPGADKPEDVRTPGSAAADAFACDTSDE
jgi:hypothetical protein